MSPNPFARLFSPRGRRAVDSIVPRRTFADVVLPAATRRALDAAQGRTSAGTATLHELDDARAQAAERYLASQDAALELDRARIALMRSTGGLEKWVEAGQE